MIHLENLLNTSHPTFLANREAEGQIRLEIIAKQIFQKNSIRIITPPA